MPIPPLEHPNASAYYDEQTRIAYITYRGSLTAEASIAVYDWIGDLTQAEGLLYGEVFDFRPVLEFAPDNLMEARKKSRRRNLRSNIHHLPVAMIVKDFYQEEILRGPMQNVPENQRKAIVQTVQDALTFIHEWHAERTQAE